MSPLTHRLRFRRQTADKWARPAVTPYQDNAATPAILTLGNDAAAFTYSGTITDGTGTQVKQRVSTLALSGTNKAPPDYQLHSFRLGAAPPPGNPRFLRVAVASP
jgi:hypothetical protein